MSRTAESIDVKNLSSRRLWEILTQQESEQELQYSQVLAVIRRELILRDQYRQSNRWQPPH